MRAALVGTTFAFLVGLVSGSSFAQTRVPLGPVERRIAVAWDQSPNGSIRPFRGAPPWDFGSTPVAVGQRTILRAAYGRVYAVSAERGEIAVIDPQTWAVIRTYSFGPSSEPLDIAVVNPNLAYVTRRSSTYLLRLNLETGAKENAADLAPYADGDGNPDMSMMAIDRGRIFVQIRRFDDNALTFALPAQLAVVDAATGDLIDVDASTPGVQPLNLAGRAAKNKMTVLDSSRRLIVGATGDAFDAGGIEVIDLDSLTSLGLAVTEEDGLTGMDISTFAMISETVGYLTFTTDFALSSHLVRFTLSGDVGAEIYATVGYFAPTLVFEPSTNLIFFPEGGGVQWGVRVFDADTGAQLTTEPIPTAGRPTDLALHYFGCGVGGDVNGDGNANGADIQEFVTCILHGGEGCECIDLDASGYFDFADASLFLDALMRP